MSVILEETPDVKQYHLRIGTTIRKPLTILRHYLKSLESQRLPPNVKVSYHFILDGCTPDVVDELSVRFCQKSRGDTVEIRDNTQPDDYTDNQETTHHWTQPAMARVGESKDRIIEKSLTDGCDAVWFVDADLMMDPGTLRSLWYAGAPIACAVYWTHWTNQPDMASAPQVWLRHPYDLSGRGFADEWSFRARLKSRALTQVWGQGACSLIRREVFEKGVRFARVPGVPLDGMMAGEDRHFCIRAESLHIPMIADPWPHIYHLYRPSDLGKAQVWEQALSEVHTEDPQSVRWLNLRIRLLEPVPGPGGPMLVPPVVARVRTNAGMILPELEKACLQHLHGESFVTALHYPYTWPDVWLRGQRRLVEVTVIDSKTDLGFPVLCDEYPDGMDSGFYNGEQLTALGLL